MNIRTGSRILRQGIIFLLITLFAGLTQAAGLLTPSDSSLPALEIRDHQVNVVIEDGYAITTIEQVFVNPHNRDLEALYSFPVPDHGTVVELTIWIDGQPVIGEVLERDTARQLYEQQKEAGQNAGITEKVSYKTFDTRVSPVLAGQDTRIRLAYIQPADVDTGIGRYVYPLEEGGVDEEKLSFWTANEQVTGKFSFDLRVRSSTPVEAVRMPNHPQAIIQNHNNGEWSVHLGNHERSADDPSSHDLDESFEGDVHSLQNENGTAFTLDQDLVIYWRHQAGLSGSVDLVAHKTPDSRRGTFMMVVTPGDDLKPIEEGKDWVFVVDVSGSMQSKYATLVDGVQRALEKMRTEDRFRIVLFNNQSWELTPGFVSANAANVMNYSQALLGVSPGNGTNLYAGLDLGLKSLDADRTSSLVLVTDGVANVGEIRQREFIELIRKKDIRMFTFVLGNSANRPLLEVLTRVSNGFAVNISNSDDIVGQLMAATSKVTHEAMHGVKISIDGIKTADLTPTHIGSLYRGQQLVIFGHYWGDGMADVRLSGSISGENKTYQTRFSFPATSVENPEIERLWAYATIEEALQEINDFGEDADLEQAVTDLAVEYGLVTDYTSMVVVSNEVFDELGIQRNNRTRSAIEETARQQRALHPEVSNRVDTQQPMYTSKRANHSGSGAIDAWTLVLLLPLVWFAWRRRHLNLRIR